VQDEALARKGDTGFGGQFTAFIPWTFQRENTALGRKITVEPTGIDYLKMLAVSRLFLDNIQHIQSSWLTQGLKLGQAALGFGADDMGSIMIEENVVSAAGADNQANERDLRYQIREAGYEPQQRDILYNYIDLSEIDEIDVRKSMPLKQLSVSFAD
jgi:cyclic dehypoxanthinyl futalosine synthase